METMKRRTKIIKNTTQETLLKHKKQPKHLCCMNTKRSYYKDSNTIIIVESQKFKIYNKEYIGGDSSSNQKKIHSEYTINNK